MSRRTDIATALTSALGFTVYPTRPVPLADGSAWLKYNKADTEDSTYGDYRLTYDLIVAISTDEAYAEEALDEMSGPLLAACNSIGLGAVVLPIPYIFEDQTLFCASVTFITYEEVDAL